MTNPNAQHPTRSESAAHPQHADGKKPFVAPQLHRVAELTEATAERTFTFTTAS